MWPGMKLLFDAAALGNHISKQFKVANFNFRQLQTINI